MEPTHTQRAAQAVDKTAQAMQFIRTCKVVCELMAFRTRATTAGGWVADLEAAYLAQLPKIKRW